MGGPQGGMTPYTKTINIAAADSTLKDFYFTRFSSHIKSNKKQSNYCIAFEYRSTVLPALQFLYRHPGEHRSDGQNPLI